MSLGNNPAPGPMLTQIFPNIVASLIHGELMTDTYRQISNI